MAELQSAGIKHGDIQPCNVSIDEKGNVKLLDIMTYEGPKSTGLKRMIQSNVHYSPLAPELMDCYMKRISPTIYNQEKADIFSLGITMLCICAITDYRSMYYDFESYKILNDKIAAEVAHLGQSGLYSPALIQALAGMLQPEVNKRLSLNQLQNYIAEHVEI